MGRAWLRAIAAIINAVWVVVNFMENRHHDSYFVWQSKLKVCHHNQYLMEYDTSIARSVHEPRFLHKNTPQETSCGVSET